MFCWGCVVLCKFASCCSQDPSTGCATFLPSICVKLGMKVCCDVMRLAANWRKCNGSLVGAAMVAVCGKLAATAPSCGVLCSAAPCWRGCNWCLTCKYCLVSCQKCCKYLPVSHSSRRCRVDGQITLFAAASRFVVRWSKIANRNHQSCAQCAPQSIVRVKRACAFQSFTSHDIVVYLH